MVITNAVRDRIAGVGQLTDDRAGTVMGCSNHCIIIFASRWGIYKQ